MENRVKISAKSARLEFNGCDPEFIRDVCKGACCRSKGAPGGTMVAVTPDEAKALTSKYSVQVQDGLISPVDKKCPFQSAESFLCNLHGTSDKPSGCIASPFTLNSNDTLIIRNRYKLLKCFRAGPRLPAYVAFRASLDLLFGLEEADKICNRLANGSGDFYAPMIGRHYDMIKGVKKIHERTLHGAAPNKPKGFFD